MAYYEEPTHTDNSPVCMRATSFLLKAIKPGLLLEKVKVDEVLTSGSLLGDIRVRVRVRSIPSRVSFPNYNATFVEHDVHFVIMFEFTYPFETKYPRPRASQIRRLFSNTRLPPLTLSHAHYIFTPALLIYCYNCNEFIHHCTFFNIAITCYCKKVAIMLQYIAQ